MAEKDIEGIIGGLKNAVERGESLEKAKQTFILAGYDAKDVDEAARHIEIPEKKEKIQPPKPAISFALQPAKSMKQIPALPETPKPKKKKGHFVRTILIIIAIIIFLLILNLIRAMIGIEF